ncbi:hypothetical protein JCM19297_285 [Nonlabens ulvanivorans]|nr:hypothetical protein [Nonlabens ulvanivorans]GAK91793.1 hypothetical protein JCM19297_285 [Nonlabens ulvanivorans]
MIIPKISNFTTIKKQPKGQSVPAKTPHSPYTFAIVRNYKKMKIISIIGIFTLIFLSSNNKNYFEGRVTYKQSYTSDRLDADSLANVSANGNLYEINHNYYRGLTYSADSAQFILDGRLGKSLYKTKNQSSFTCYDHTQVNSKIGTIKKNDSIKIINGFRCKSFQIISNGRTATYFYSLDYKMHPQYIFKILRMELERTNGTIKRWHYN